MSYYYDHQDDCRDRRIDSDLSYNAEYNDLGGFRLEDVCVVLAALMGENDGPAYHWIVMMKDHTYAYITGSCDYTGWDCQSWGDATLTVTLKEALKSVEDKETRSRLRKQLTGDEPFGSYTE